MNDVIANASRLHPCLSTSFIRKKEISDEMKTIMFRAVRGPTLIYGRKSWVLSNPMKSKLHAMEMKFLRGVKGAMRTGVMRNDIIRGDLGVESV